MKKSYESGVATHIGPESCGAARKSGVEALTGERAGRVFSRVREFLRDADAVRRSGRPHRVRRYREACQSPARSETPCTYGDASRGEPGGPQSTQGSCPGTHREVQGRTPMMNGPGKSDRPVVPEKSSNKTGRANHVIQAKPVAEGMRESSFP